MWRGVRREKTKMAFIIVLAIYDGGIDLAVPAFVSGLVIWYASFFASGCTEPDDMIGI